MIPERLLYRKAMMVAEFEAVFIATSPCCKPGFDFLRFVKRATRRLVRWFHRGIPWNGEWVCIGPCKAAGLIWWHPPSGREVAGYPRCPTWILREGRG